MKKMKYDVVFHCGAKITDVKEIVPVGTKIGVYEGKEDTFRKPVLDNGHHPFCISCPCKRKARRRKNMFYTAEDVRSHRRPTGIKIECAVAENIEK
jgi:hypothetical protein